MRNRSLTLIAVGTLVVSLIPSVSGSASDAGWASHRPAYLNAGLAVGRRVDDLLGRMTLEEKIGQMTQAERGAVAGDPTLIAQWGLGSVLSGGGSTPTPNTPAAWVAMVNEFQRQALSTRLGIPHHLRDRRRPRARKRVRGDGVPPQHRPRRDA